MKRILLAAAFAALALGSTQAADLTEPVPQPYNWSGLYLGGQVGWEWLQGNISDPASNRDGDFSDDDFIYGGHIGANYQIDSIVLGAEADIDEGELHAVTSDPNLFGVTASADLGLQGSVRARLGWARDNLLIYATGGWAWSSADFDYSFLGKTSSFDTSLDGWTVGGGLEYGWDQWSARLEYRYTDYGHESHNITECCAPPPFEQKWDLNTHAIRLGISYRFLPF